MKIKDIYEVEIINNDLNGNGICRVDNFVVFVKNSLKGEKLKIQIDEIKKKYAKGSIIEILSKNDKRCNPPCKYYNSCGGCNFLHTTFENEITIKKEYLSHLFNRKINYLEVKNETNYRNKVILHVINNKIGLFDEKTHNIIEIDNCILLNEKINITIKELKLINLENVSEIMIRCINNKIMINIKTSKITNDIKNIICDSLYINNEYVKGEKYLIDEINEYKFSIYPSSFYQVNREGMTNIYNKAKEYAGNGNNLLDLYCGTGTIGIWLHENFKNIVGCEINKDSIENAKINLKLNNIDNIKFILSDAKNINGNYDVIIVDPPRSGLDKTVINFLNNSKAKKIIYISCNPLTLKRDIDLLLKYNLKEISASSMFPKTAHIESVAFLGKI